MNNSLHVRTSRTAAGLGTVVAATALALGAAGPAQALSCPAGYIVVVFNGIESCSPTGTGGTAGDGTGPVGDGGSTVPGGAAPIAGGSGGAPLEPAPYAPAPAPYVSAAPGVSPAPVTASAPVQPVKGFAPAENPVIAGVAAEAPAAEAVPTGTAAAVAPSATAAASAAPSATPSPSVTPTLEPIGGGQSAETDNGTAPGFIAGSLGVLVVAAAIVFYRRKLQAAQNRRTK